MAAKAEGYAKTFMHIPHAMTWLARRRSAGPEADERTDRSNRRPANVRENAGTTMPSWLGQTLAAMAAAPQPVAIAVTTAACPGMERNLDSGLDSEASWRIAM